MFHAHNTFVLSGISPIAVCLKGRSESSLGAMRSLCMCFMVEMFEAYSMRNEAGKQRCLVVSDSRIILVLSEMCVWLSVNKLLLFS